MKLLAVVPHSHLPPDADPASSRGDLARKRDEALSMSIVAMHANFGAGQHVIDYAKSTTQLANRAALHQVVVIVCTPRGGPPVDRLPIPASLFTHRALDAGPESLGVECRRILRDHLRESFDHYLCLESGGIIRDPLFFEKQEWFTVLAGGDCVLQPNRYRIDPPGARKIYLDAAGPPPGGPAAEQLEFPLLDRRITFFRPADPFLGSFFLSQAQLERWAGQPQFLDLHPRSTGGLRVYRPSLDAVHFLEIELLSPDPDTTTGTWFIDAG
jgi:hypothetical protein